MQEDEVFGLRDPESGDLGFVSVMGILGEHPAVAVYLGPRALAEFLDLHRAPPDVLNEYPEYLLEIPQLQASFEDRADLENWDRQLLRNLNRKFRGRNAWPRFQSFRPGFMPWQLEPEEVRFLTLALEQLEDVAPRLHKNQGLLIGKEIHVQSSRLVGILEAAFEELGTKIVLKPSLKKLRAANRELLAHFMRGPRF